MTADARRPGGAAVQAGPFLIIGLAAAFVAWHWQDIPVTFPVHWTLAGAPDGWRARSILTVFAPTIIATCIFAMLTLIVSGVIAASRSRPHPGPHGEMLARIRRIELMMVLAVEYAVAAIIARVQLMPLRATPPSPLFVITAVVVVFVIVIAALTAIARIQRTAVAQGIATGRTATPAACWHWGLFYYNPDDPSLWVERRIGMGWTLNLAHRRAWAATGFLLLLSLTIAVIASIAAR